MRDIALMGYARSGKDSAGSHLVDAYGYERVSFADPVRESLLALDPIVSPMGDMRLSKLVDILGWDRAKSEFPEVRRLLQAHGTDAVRGVMGPHTWVRVAQPKVWGAQAAKRPVVITDCRFPNERDAVREWGFRLIWIQRPGGQPMNDHVSDKSLSESDADYVVYNDGSLEDLQLRIATIASI